MRYFIKALYAAIAVSVIAACGGGGGGGGTPTGPSATLRLYPPISEVGIPVGASGYAGVEVRGGKAPYRVTSSDASVSAGLSADGMLYLESKGDGTSTVVVYDESLPVQQVRITVTAKAVPLASSAGTSITLQPNQTLQFNVRGGIAPYSVNSSDTSIASASISGSAITVTAKPKAGTATLVVTDAAGVTLNVSITVQVGTLTTSPTTITGAAGTSNTITINGGVAPYSVSSSNTAVASASLSGSSVSVNLLSQGTSSIAVTDAAGQTVVVSISVTSNVLQVSPANQTVNERSASITTVTYLIAGGTAPYTPLISPADAVHATASIAANTMTVTVPVSAVGVRCVTADKVIPIDVYDSKLVKQTVSLTIKDDSAVACP